MYFQEKIDFRPEEVLIYLRKSRSDDPSLSVEEVLNKHETMLDEWSMRNLGALVPAENRFREVVSGETIADRPQMQTLLKLIESPKYKAVLVKEVERLSRGDLMDAGLLIRTFRYTKTLVMTPEMTFDIQNEYARDRFERELKRGNEYLEYTKKIMNAGRLLSVKQGNYIGNVPPYGYEKDWVMDGKRKCPTLKIHPQQAHIVEKIFTMYIHQDMGPSLICRYLDSLAVPAPKGKHWSAASVRDILRNIHYTGKVQWYGRKTVHVIQDGEVIKTRPVASAEDILIYDGKHPAIISEDLFYAAQEKIGRHHRAKPNTKVRNPFASLIYCKKCGRAINYRPYNDRNQPPRMLCANQVHCGNGSCLYSEVEESVRTFLQDAVQELKIKVKNANAEDVILRQAAIKDMERRKKELDAKELSIWEAQYDPDPSKRMPAHIFQQMNTSLQREKIELEAALMAAHTSTPSSVLYKGRLERFQAALDALNDPNMAAEQKNKLLKECIDRITYDKEKPERISSVKEQYTLSDRDPIPFFRTSANRWTSMPVRLEIRLKS